MMQLTILSSPDQIAEHGTTFSVSHLLWGTKHAPAVTGSIGYVQEDGFYVEMICEESDPLRRYEGLYAPVYLDSAMELSSTFRLSEKENRSLRLTSTWNLTQTVPSWPSMDTAGQSARPSLRKSAKVSHTRPASAVISGRSIFASPSLFLKRFTESPDFSRKTAFPVILQDLRRSGHRALLGFLPRY